MESKNNWSWTEPLVVCWYFYSEQGQVKSGCSGPCQIKFWLSTLDSQASLANIFQCLIILMMINPNIKKNQISNIKIQISKKSIQISNLNLLPRSWSDWLSGRSPSTYFLVSALCIGAQGWSVLAVRILLSLSFFLAKFVPLSTYMN